MKRMTIITISVITVGIVSIFFFKNCGETAITKESSQLTLETPVKTTEKEIKKETKKSRPPQEKKIRRKRTSFNTLAQIKEEYEQIDEITLFNGKIIRGKVVAKRNLKKDNNETMVYDMVVPNGKVTFNKNEIHVHRIVR